mgnify:CR=1 FL=1
MELEARKAVLYSIFDAGVRAVAPDAALMRHVCLEDGQLLVDGQSWKLPRRGRLLVRPAFSLRPMLAGWPRRFFRLAFWSYLQE